MADQTIKNQNQPANAAIQNGSLQVKENKLSNSLNPESAANAILDNQRKVNEVQTNQRQLAFNALFQAGTSQQNGPAKVNIAKGPSGLRSRSNRTDKPRISEKSSSATSAASAELREQIAIRTAVNQKATAATASNRGTQVNRNGVTNPQGLDNIDGASTTLGTQQNLVGTDNTQAGQTNSTQNQNVTTQTAQDPLNKIELRTSAETLKLLDVVGPEAILTFREKLQQVWVNLDDKATRQLDVIARLPAGLNGTSAMELLAIESPQGIHFVAFLKNKNDFEVLATFDRRALLPDHSSRQLIEAGLMSYEQLDAVFKEGSQKIEESARNLAKTKGTHDQVFMHIQQLMVQEKRRRRKFRQMIDYLVDKLDELDLEEGMEDAPFVPKDLNKKDQEQQETEEFDQAGKIDFEKEKDFDVQFDDSEVH